MKTNTNTPPIDFSDFLKVDIRVGKIIAVNDFPKARKPAYQLQIDFGPTIGIKKTSAQITARYQAADLLHTHVLAVVNFPPKQIANFMSEVLVLGLSDEQGDIVLLRPDADDIPLGSRMH